MLSGHLSRLVCSGLFFAASTAFAGELVESTPTSVPGATTADTAIAKGLFEQGAAFVDLRKESMWNSGRVPGAIWLDFKQSFSRAALEAEVKKDEPVVFYCSGEHCPRSSKASNSAVTWGYKSVFYYREGFPAWKSAGLPVE